MNGNLSLKAGEKSSRLKEEWSVGAYITPSFHHSTTPVPLGFAALQYVIA